jgi:mannose-1-phosphate guanylyltransferase
MTNNNVDLWRVLLAGGSGTRLWPVSRKLHPKQFSTGITDSSQTLLQQTALRLDGMGISNTLTLCNEEHRFLVAEQLRAIDRLGPIILEPEGRNTAPAIALAALTAMAEGGDPILLVLPSDHQILDANRFEAATRDAIALAAQGQLVTFGVVPTEPATGYGYIKVGQSINETGYKVRTFVEKPDLETAKSLLSAGGNYWNSGMFVFKASVYLTELKRHRPNVFAACERAVMDMQQDMSFIRVNQQAFLQSPSISIDHAIMEKTQHASLVPLDVGWSDLGTWGSIWTCSEKAQSDNVTRGNVVLHDAQGCLAVAEDRLLGLVGVKDLVVIETKDSVLVCDRARTEEVKGLTDVLQKAGAAEVERHREVFRPWGKFESISSGNSYQVKKLTVKPGAKLSLQKHQHRAEHWVVVSGTAKVTKGQQEILLAENQSTYISVGEVHSLENPGQEDLELIEVQSGSYLGEDDIIRLEDRYSRT